MIKVLEIMYICRLCIWNVGLVINCNNLLLKLIRVMLDKFVNVL